MSLIPNFVKKLTFKKVVHAVEGVAKTVVNNIPVVGTVAATVEGIAAKTGKNLDKGQPLPAAVSGAVQSQKAEQIGNAVTSTAEANLPLILGAALVILLLTRKGK